MTFCNKFQCTPNELTNGVITACFMLLFKDLIRLFACYNDGVINLLGEFVVATCKVFVTCDVTYCLDYNLKIASVTKKVEKVHSQHDC